MDKKYLRNIRKYPVPLICFVIISIFVIYVAYLLREITGWLYVAMLSMYVGLFLANVKLYMSKSMSANSKQLLYFLNVGGVVVVSLIVAWYVAAVSSIH